MATVSVIDSYSLVKLDEVAEPTLKTILDELTDVVADGALNFPDLVHKDCEKYAKGSLCTLWARAVAGHRRPCAPPSEYMDAVLNQCGDLLDLTLVEWQPQIDVAAMALYLSEDLTVQVQVVTDDLHGTPDRMALVEACAVLGIQTVTVDLYVPSVTSCTI